eukprot:TRINITY_DN11726_c0_g1_i7.p1 TRINITY_DN11726_c0_g1~~TRINITY_DN11726_c0_g1_i7.p1  ORF type:complete len:176 (-),score=50.40 TRINITY_DN11726_c0_g1_i7:528-1055(-)
MRRQLMREKKMIKEQIERKIGAERLRRENNTVGVDVPSCTVRNTSLVPAKTSPSKSSPAHKVAIAKFLARPYDNPIWKPNNPRIESVMNSAIKRYEMSLGKAEEAAVTSEREIKENIQNWYKLLDLEASKRKLNELNTRKILELQIEQKVTIVCSQQLEAEEHGEKERRFKVGKD